MAVIRVLVTGAAGQIGYSLLPLLAGGKTFGPSQKIILHLLDIPPAEKVLNGVVMELEDCAYPLLEDVVATTDVAVAFKDIDVAILVGAMPRREGMERKDLLKANAGIFKVQGNALDQYAKKSVKVLVVGNPANTNCLIASTCAPSIPKNQFSALTRLDQNRARGMIAKKLKVNVAEVQNVVIWGNHSSTQYPDITLATVSGKPVAGQLPLDFLQGEYVKAVQTRGAAVIKARGLSSAASAANAISNHLESWIRGTAPGEIVSMGVPSDGSYGIKEGVIYSYPVTCKDGNVTIVKDVAISDFSRTMLDATAEELFQEREDALSFVA